MRKRKRKRFESFIWQMPLCQQKIHIDTNISNNTVDYTTTTGRRRTVSWSYYSNPTGVVCQFYRTNLPTHRKRCATMDKRKQIVLNILHDTLKLTWKVIYHWKRQPYFSCEPFSKTGYWLDVCYGWLHLHGLTRAARSKSRELQNEKFLPIPGLDLTTPDSQV